MTSTLVLFATTAALVLSAGLLAASLELRSPAGYLLAAYVIGWAEIVLLVGVLSFAHLVVRSALIGGASLLFVASILVWLRSGRPRGPAPRTNARMLLDALRDPPIGLLAVAVVLGFLYLTALAVFTPPNSVDAMWYHLSRAAFWKQQHGLGYIPNANDARLNGNPPVAEIGALYTMVVGTTDRFVTMVALSAYAATSVGVFGIARRLRADRGSALCAGLTFATLPVVALQASGALNDLVIAAFAVACVYFFLGKRNVETVLAGLALALALGTKVYGPLLLPIIALAWVYGKGRARGLKVLSVGAVSIAVGSAWYVVNLVRTGSLLGHLASHPSDVATRGFAASLAITARYLIDFGEVPGAGGWWVTCYVAPTLVIAGLLLRNRGRWPTASIVAAGLVSLVPFLVIALGPTVKRGYQYVLFHLGRRDLGVLDYGRSVYGATPMSSFYGPLGLVILLLVFALIAWRRRIGGVAIALAAAPLLLVIEVALFIGYGDLNGRFFAFAVALATGAFAVVLPSRPLTWAVLALAVPTLALTLRANAEKPPSVWGEPRWQVQTQIGPGNGEVELIRFADESLPSHAHVGLALDPNDWSYPFFGPHLERHVVFVPSTQAVPADLGWLVVAPDKPTPPFPWRQVLRADDDFRLYRR